VTPAGRTRSRALRCRRRQPAVRRIDDERGAVLEVPVGQPVLTVRTGGAQSCRRPVGEQRQIERVAEGRFASARTASSPGAPCPPVPDPSTAACR
jgi:hypothetical protein